jgi:glycerol-3-phosphate dehydrogenase (NAD(P)+)
MGAGSWGTTFAQVLCDAGTPAVLWARDPAVAESVSATRENPRYLPGITLPEGLAAQADPAAALAGADMVVLAVPAQTLRASLAAWAPLLPPGVLLVSLMKGIELGTCKRMSEVIAEALDISPTRVAVVSGPTWPARSPSGSSPRPWSRAPMRPSRGSCSRPATPRTSGRTGAPTSSAASSAGR